MALAESGPAPYAPTRAITLVIDQYRDKGLPTPINTATLSRIGIEDSLTQRTYAALKQLDLIDEAGEPSKTLEKIRVSPTDALPDVLADWLREAYKPIFTYIAPTDDVQRVADQFRHYVPGGQRNRMVTLFLGLCAKAGLIEEMPPMPRGAGKQAKSGGSRQKPKASPQEARQTKRPKEAEDRPPRSTNKSELGEARQRYLDLLISKATEQAEPDDALLDRIERALGIANKADQEVDAS